MAKSGNCCYATAQAKSEEATKRTVKIKDYICIARDVLSKQDNTE